MDDKIGVFMQSRLMSLYDDLLEEMTMIRLVNTVLGNGYVTYCIAYVTENGDKITEDTWENRKYIVDELLRLHMIPENSYVTIEITANAWEVSVTAVDGLSFDELETDPIVSMFLNLAVFATNRDPKQQLKIEWLVDTAKATFLPIKWSLPCSEYKADTERGSEDVRVTTCAANNDNHWTTPLLRTSLDLGPLGDIDIKTVEKNTQTHLLKGKTTVVSKTVAYDSRADYITMGTIINGVLS